MRTERVPTGFNPLKNKELNKLERFLKNKKFLSICVVAVGILGLVLAPNPAKARPPGVTFLKGTINANGGGAWVMAMDESLPTRPRTIVVSDARQRYEIPDLVPGVEYTVLGRAYGCKDKWIKGVKTGHLAIHLDCDISPQEAAQIYPANYWASIVHFPAAGDFPGTGPIKDGGNGIGTGFGERAEFIARFYLSCHLCHQVGGPAARKLTSPFLWDRAMRMTKTPQTPGFPAGLDVPGHIPGASDTRSSSGGNMFGSYRGYSGGVGSNDTGIFVDSPDGHRLDNQFATMMGDWATRIANGETPPMPARPTGRAAQAVIQEWDLGTRHTYNHDGISTHAYDPTVNAHGVFWAVDIGQDYLWGIDPVTHDELVYKVPMLTGYNKGEAYQHVPWCDQPGFCSWSVYENPANPHTVNMDKNGLVWFTTATARNQDRSIPGTPGYLGALCDDVPPGPPYNGAFHGRSGIAAFDPGTETFHLVNTCGGTHHLAPEPVDDCIWISGDSFVLQRWCPTGPPDVGTYDFWEITRDNIDGSPAPGFLYGINVAPDGTVWAATPGFPGRIIHFDPDCDRGALPPRASSTGTLGCTFEYVPPAPGGGPRGIDVDTRGVAHTGLGGSNHLGIFDESACVTPACSEGWNLVEFPGPRNQGPDGAEIPASERGPADWYYYNYVDKFNSSGVGADTSWVCGTGSDSVKAYWPYGPRAGEKVTYRIPYPLGTFSRLMDARIDDEDGGCKDRAVWLMNGMDPARFIETGQPQAVRMWFRDCEIEKKKKKVR